MAFGQVVYLSLSLIFEAKTCTFCAAGVAEPGSIRCAHHAAKIPHVRDGASWPFGDDPSRKKRCAPRRGQSVPRPAFGSAMLTLLRLPF